MSSQKILFIQSAGPQGPKEGSDFLISYLIESLTEFEFICPQMPDPENPNYLSWKKCLDKELIKLDDAILVGHSLGGSVLLKYITETSSVNFAGLFLVAVPFWGAKDWEVDEYLLTKDFSKKLNPSKVFLYHSQDDEVVPVKHMELYSHQLLGAKSRALENRGHLFSNGLPELIRDIKSLQNG